MLAVAYHVAVFLLPLLFSRDVYSYAFYGRIVGIYHQNPYVHTPVEFAGDSLWPLVGPKWVDTPAVYGPLFTSLSGGIARVHHLAVLAGDRLPAAHGAGEPGDAGDDRS